MHATKIALITSFFVISILTGCTSTNSENNLALGIEDAKEKIDWPGIYQGIFPCNGCDGIATMLRLNPDMSYEIRTREIGKQWIDNRKSGKFYWATDNKHISLDNNEYVVGDDILVLVKENNKPISQKVIQQYLLTKTD